MIAIVTAALLPQFEEFREKKFHLFLFFQISKTKMNYYKLLYLRTMEGNHCTVPNMAQCGICYPSKLMLAAHLKNSKH